MASLLLNWEWAHWRHDNPDDEGIVASIPGRGKTLALSSCLYRASMTIKTVYYPTDAQIYNS